MHRGTPGRPCYEIYLKKSDVTRSTNHNILHILIAEGLHFLAISTLYRSSKQCQLLTSNDSTVRHMAEKNLESEMAFIIRKKFKSAVEVQQVMPEDPSLNRRALSMAARSIVSSSDAGRRKSELLALPTQCLLFTTLTDASALRRCYSDSQVCVQYCT